MHYLPFGARLNKGILMVTQLKAGFCLFFYIRQPLQNRVPRVRFLLPLSELSN